MCHLRRGAPKEDAQKTSGLTNIEWQYFIVRKLQRLADHIADMDQGIAKQQADEYVKANPNTPYRSYTPSQKTSVIDSINSKLAEDSIRQVREDIVAWKMHTLIRDGIAKGKGKGRRQTRDKGAIEGDTASNASSLVTKSASPADPPREPTSDRPFDPIRDI